VQHGSVYRYIVSWTLEHAVSALGRFEIMYLSHSSYCVALLPFVYFSHGGGCSPNWVNSARRPLLAYWICSEWLGGWRIWWNKDLQGESFPPATSFTTNPAWLEPVSNPGSRGGNLSINCSKYGAAFRFILQAEEARIFVRRRGSHVF
jgi:hypothetical protein